MYVVLMMAAAEAMSPQGTLFGAAVTFVLYGLLPMSIVLYVMGAPRRRQARRQADARAMDAQGIQGAEGAQAEAAPFDPPTAAGPDGGADQIKPGG